MERKYEKVIVVGCQLDDVSDERYAYSLAELESLTKTAQGEVVMTLTQKRDRPHPAFYIGKGKVEELQALVEEFEPEIVIFNDELSPSQNRNLARELDVRIIDRTQLILDIFAQRAKSREGQLQVELAQLQYLLPRLAGQGVSLSRLGGGIGTRGPGETKLETDRRHIRGRVDELKRQLSVIVEHRQRYRQRRKASNIFQLAIVGYTNAGKSTMFNRLTAADAFEEDLLFATLDPLTRKLQLPHKWSVLVTDTVGFIQDLPTSLVAAFRSTLEEVKEADVILHVIDCSNPDYMQHEETVLELIEQLEANEVPVITIYNKKDAMHENFVPKVANSLIVSVFDKDDIAKIKERIETELFTHMVRYVIDVPSYDGKLLARIKDETVSLSIEFDEATENYVCRGYMMDSHPFKEKMRAKEEEENV